MPKNKPKPTSFEEDTSEPLLTSHQVKKQKFNESKEDQLQENKGNQHHISILKLLVDIKLETSREWEKNLSKEGLLKYISYSSCLEVSIAENDSDYEELKNDTAISKKRKRYVQQKWKIIESVSQTYYQIYVDNLIRQKIWLFKSEYSNSNYHVLKCAQGNNCPYKRRIFIEEEEIELPENHVLNELWKTVFNKKSQKLKVEENDQNHQDHFSEEDTKKKFEARSHGCSDFTKLIVRKLNLHLKKHSERVSLLQNLLKNTYISHVPKPQSLSNFCYQLKVELFFKDFDGSIGSFEELVAKYSYEKAEGDSDLIILGINKDIESFTLVFSCKHFLTHFRKQKDSNQPSFFVSDTTFSLLKNNYKLLVLG